MLFSIIGDTAPTPMNIQIAQRILGVKRTECDAREEMMDSLLNVKWFIRYLPHVIIFDKFTSVIIYYISSLASQKTLVRPQHCVPGKNELW